MSTPSFSLDEFFEHLEFANPHTLIWTHDFKLLKVGKGFLKSLPKLYEGCDFNDFFKWEAKDSIEKLFSAKPPLLFIESKDGSLLYKVSAKKKDWGIVFHASPVINSEHHISQYNLTLKDFPQQDYISEFLFLLQTSTRALIDSRNLTDKLTQKNRDLRESQNEIALTALFSDESPNPILRFSKKFELLYSNEASQQFLVDFKILNSKVTDEELKLNILNVELNPSKKLSLFLNRNNSTYLVNINCSNENDFYNIYAADITHYVNQVTEKERELSVLNKRLDDQQKFYEYILNNIPSDIAVFDDKHRYLFVNPQGIQNDDVRAFMIGKDDFDYCNYKGISTKSAEFRRSKFHEVMEKNIEIEWEDDLIDGNGNRKIIMRRLRPLTNPFNQKKHVVGYGIDITERKIAEENVKSSNDRLQLLEQFLNAASDAIQVANDEGGIVYVNDSASKRLGIAVEDLYKFKVKDIDHQFKVPGAWEAHLKELKSVGHFSAETKNVNQETGKEIDVEINVKYQSINGKGYFIAASRDITERKMGERLLDYKNGFQAILMDVAMKYIDINPNQLSETITNTLAQIGNFVKVDRVYIFEYNNEEQYTSNTFEWVADGISKEIDNLQKIPFDSIPVWVDKHGKGENIIVENSDDLPEGIFKEMLLEQNIKSLISFPLMNEGVCIGFVGFDSVKQTRTFYEDEKELLQLYTRMLVNVEVRMKSIKAIEESNKKITQINEELQKIIQAEKTVNLLAKTFMNGTNYEDICWEIVENIISQLDFEDCVIYKLEKTELVQVAALGEKIKKRRVLKNSMRIPFGKGIVGSVAKTGKELFVPDTSIDKRYIVDDQKRLSEIAVPIKIGNRVWGVIDSENLKKGFFTKLHLRVLMTISNMLAQKITGLEQQGQKERLQAEILKINADLENRVSEEINRNQALTKSMSDQEKLVTIGEIASGIAHDLNTPLGAIKIGAESIRFTLDNLFHNVVMNCSESQLKRACNRAIEMQEELFVGGLQQRKEMRLLDEFLENNYPELDNIQRTKMVTLFVKTRILPDQKDFIEEIIKSTNSLEYLELIYGLQIVRSFIETILTSSDRATNVIQDLRSFIKDQRQKEKSPVNLFDNISTVLNVFNYEIKKNVELIFKVDKNLFIEGLDIKLFQLWSNIIKNAIESFHQQKIRGVIKIESDVKDGFAIISISNNGPKIPDEIKNRMFDKFYTTKANRNGSGLGLSIVKSVLDEHNAKMSLESNDQWTTFSIQMKLINLISKPKNQVEIELL